MDSHEPRRGSSADAQRSHVPDSRANGTFLATRGLDHLGWRRWFAEHFAALQAPDLVPARVAIQYRDRVRALTREGEVDAAISATSRGTATLHGQPPAVGDWVALAYAEGAERQANVRAILPRQTAFTRKIPGGEILEQVVAANVDTVFLVDSLDRFNVRRLERSLVAAWASGAQPVVVLTKTDLCPNHAPLVEAARGVALSVPVHAISVLSNDGLEAIRGYLHDGETIALVGPSGVGKSTLINYLAGSEVARTADVRSSDRRGRHTTTHRELMLLPSGGAIIDSPGLRELQLWDARAGHAQTFVDIERLAGDCRFRDCTHGPERGCSVQAAVRSGILDAGRLAGYLKLRREVEHFESRNDQRTRAERKRRDREIHRQSRKHRPRE